MWCFMSSKKKIIIISLIFIIFIGISVLIFYSIPSFKVQRFDEIQEIDVFNNYDSSNINVCYGNIFKCTKVIPKQEGSVDTYHIGSYTIKWIWEYKGKALTKTQTVNVVDKEKPVIKVEGDTIYYCPNGNINAPKITATDNYDGDITDKITKELIGDVYHLKVADSSGNISDVSYKALKKDEEKPKITLKGDNPLYIKTGSSYSEPGYSAIDNCDGDITSKVKTSNNIKTNVAGEYYVKYSVQDEMGNTITVERKIYVYRGTNVITPNGKSIYLTFDDGPSMYTNKLLDILKKYDVKATFFVTDQPSRYDSCIKRAYDEGHTIAMHSATHNYKYIYSSIDNYFKDLEKIQNKIKRITGETMYMLRFPGGSSNTVSRNYDKGIKIMSKLTKMVEARGYRYFDWNVSSGDAGNTTKTSKVYSNVVNSLGNGKTYIVLQHDSKGYSVNAVEDIIKYGLSRGYNFRPLTMNSPTIHHGVNN